MGRINEGDMMSVVMNDFSKAGFTSLLVDFLSVSIELRGSYNSSSSVCVLMSENTDIIMYVLTGM